MKVEPQSLVCVSLRPNNVDDADAWFAPSRFKLISSQGFRDYVTAYPAFSAKLSDLNWDAWFTQVSSQS